MDLQSYLAQQCAIYHVQRGQLPALLGLTNTNKALRRIDALCRGIVADNDLIARMRHSALMQPDDFDAALRTTVAFVRTTYQQRYAAHEAHERSVFVPHLWAQHRPGPPDIPIAAVGLVGLDTFKRLDVPPRLFSGVPASERLAAIERLLQTLDLNQQEHRRLRVAFGPPMFFHYRDTFDHYYTYDMAAHRFVSESSGCPPQPHVVVRLR